VEKEMNRHRLALVVTVCLFLIFMHPVINAQIRPICDVTCSPGPDPTVSSSYRVLPINDRGIGGGIPRRHWPPRPPPKAPKPAELVLGSSSYQYNVPLFFLPGRNGLNLNLAAHYNSGIWSEDTVHRTITFNADRDNPSYGFRVDFGFIDMQSTPYVLTEPDGTKHAIDADLLTSTDGSNIKLDTSQLTATYKNGNVVFYEYTSSSDLFLRPTKVRDANGNFISISYAPGTEFSISTITDTLGRQVVFGYNGSGKLISITTGGKTIMFSWNPTTYLLAYSFSQLTVKNSPATGTPINVITAITKPDGTSTQFLYGGWGIVNRIENRSKTNALRSYISFLYPDPNAVSLLNSPSYTQKTVSFDGTDTNTAVWNFSVTQDSAGNITSQTVKDPRGVVTTTTLDSSGFPAKTQIFASSSSQTALHTVMTAWLGNYPQTVTTTLDDGSQSKVAYVFDANGNATDVKQYNFDGSLTRETAFAYATIGANVLDRPSQVLVKDAGSNTVSRTDIAYDEYASFPLTTYSPAAVQHDEQNFSASNHVRGNPTTIKTYSNAAAQSGTIVTRNLTYDILGNVVIVGGTCCVPQQITFNSDTQYAYPVSLATGPSGDALALTSSSTYDLPTGLPKTVTDANGQQIQFTYDADNRLTQTKFPDLSTASTDFDDSSASPTVTSYNSSNSLETVATLDGTGRTLSTQIRNKASGDIISTSAAQYDLLAGTFSASSPYAPGETPKYTVTATDELGRVIQTTPPGNTGSDQASYSGASVTLTDAAGKQRKQFKDALGQLIRVEEPGGTGGSSGAGSFTINGTEGSVSTSNGNGATAGTGNVTFSGSERSTPVLTHPATAGSGTVTITGSESSTQVCQDNGFTDPPRPPICTTVYDSGTLSISLNGLTKSTAYGRSSTSAALASTLASAFNGDASSAATASVSGSVITFTAKTTGAATNYALSGSCSTNDPTDFGSGSFCPSSANSLTGGTDNGYTTMYDTGNVSVTVNGMTKSTTFGQGSTSAGTATTLASAFNVDSASPVIANAANGVLSLTTKSTGVATNYPLSVSSVTNSQYFAAGSASFPASASGASMLPGQNGTAYDAGTVTVTITGFGPSSYTKAVNYSQGSTPSSIASGLLGAFNSDPGSPVAASIPAGSPNTVNLVARTIGADTNYGIVVTSATTQTAYFTQSSFSGTSVSLTGGADDAVSMSTPLSTSYSYNARGQLRQVTQGQQTRTYQYDDLGRLTSSAVPEIANASTTFTYKDFGAAYQRTDPRGIVTTYTYDTLNRLKQTTYSDQTPPVVYTYGGAGAANFGAGRFTQIADGSGTQTFKYDSMRRSVQVSRTVGGNSYTTQYSYSAGQLSTITYPSGRTVAITPDAIGRLGSIGSNGSNLLTVGAYNAAGQVTNLAYGDGMEQTYTYNDQLQLQRMVAGSTTTLSLDLTYNYGSADNGQIQSITDNMTASQSTSYAYDELGRLKTAQTTDLVASGTWKLGFKYDRYGNRLAEIPQGGTASMPLNEVAVDPTTNRISGLQYDAAGNLTNDGLHSYGYDAENRMITIDGGAETFVYDGASMRVKKGTTVYIYEGGHVIAEYANGAPASFPTVEYVGRIASFSGTTPTYFYRDHLSNRFFANSSGTVTATLSQFPFGELTSGSASTKWAFTNYERDNAAGDSGLDYAYARFYSSRLGRFMSVDPLSGSIGNPQSLNRFSYVMNDPVNLADPAGRNASINHVCLLKDNGDSSGFCVGGGGGMIGGDPFASVNADPFGAWTDPTKWDPLAEGEARYEQQVAGAFGEVAAAGTTASLNGHSWTWNGTEWVNDANGAAIGDGSELGLGTPVAEVSNVFTPDFASQLRLVPTSDCSYDGMREIVYEVRGAGSTHVFVTEHQNPASWAPPNGTSTDKNSGEFDDTIFGWAIGNSIQTFTVSAQATSAATASYPILVQLPTGANGGMQDFAALGLWHGGTNGKTFINGNSKGFAPCSRKPGGYY
jgi:RHS repeat-associated protein